MGAHNAARNLSYSTQTDNAAISGNLTVDGTATITGATAITGATMVSSTLAVGSSLSVVGGVSVAAASGVTTVGPLVKLTETVGIADFTDNTDTTGTYELTVGTIPAGATFLFAALTAVTEFAGDTSAVITIGDGTDVDRYHTGTPNVFVTAAAGVAVGSPSGTLYHAAEKTVTLIVTTNADFTTAVTDGSGALTIELYYLT